MTARAPAFALALSLCAYLAPALSRGQETPERGESRASTATAIEQIVVTARRREEDPQLVPIAMSSLSADELRERAIFDIEDIGEYAPNVTMTSAAGNVREIVIRGIGGGNADPRVSSGAGVYIDGVFLNGPFGAFSSTLDIERTEVLRGPQGTMFGRNATGGAVNIVTRRPHGEFEATTTLRLGEYGQRDISASINLPVAADRFFVRGAVAVDDDDGYYKELTTGRGYGDSDRSALYLTGRWLPTDRWTIDVTARHFERERVGNGGNCNFVRRTFLNGLLHESGGGGDFKTACGATTAAGPFNFYSDVNAFGDFSSSGLFAVAAWESDGTVGPFDTSSITINAAVFDQAQRFLSDRDYTTERLLSIGSFQSQNGEIRGRGTEGSSFELIHHGTLLDGRLDLTLGLNHFDDEDSPEGEDCIALYLSVRGTGSSATCSRPGGLYVEILPFNVISSTTPRGAQTFADNTANAVFFHGVYDVSDDWFLDLGGRWTSEKRWFKAMEWAPMNVIAGRDQIINELSDATVDLFEQDQGRWEAFTSSIGLSRRLPTSRFASLDEGIGYVTLAEGFNSGGFNFGLPQELLGAFYSFGPENVRSLELGFKSTWSDGRLRLNVAAFYTDYSDKHVEIVVENAEELFDDPAFGFTDNVAEVTIKGLEIESELRTDSGLRFRVAASYLSNEFTEYTTFDPDNGVNLALTNLNIEDLTPDYTLNAELQYSFGLSSNASLTPRLRLYWQDEYDFAGGFRDDPPSDCLQDAYTKLDARLTWRSADRRSELALFGTNISDELILRSCLISGLTGRRETHKAPARWGVEATYRFGR